MDYIREISEMYHGNISLQPPCQTEIASDVPAEITSILHVSDGICETMADPETGEVILIGSRLFIAAPPMPRADRRW